MNDAVYIHKNHEKYFKKYPMRLSVFPSLENYVIKYIFSDSIA